VGGGGGVKLVKLVQLSLLHVWPSLSPVAFNLLPGLALSLGDVVSPYFRLSLNLIPMFLSHQLWELQGPIKAHLESYTYTSTPVELVCVPAPAYLQGRSAGLLLGVRVASDALLSKARAHCCPLTTVVLPPPSLSAQLVRPSASRWGGVIYLIYYFNKAGHT
jgi:hypothetical protein